MVGHSGKALTKTADKRGLATSPATSVRLLFLLVLSELLSVAHHPGPTVQLLPFLVMLFFRRELIFFGDIY